MRKGYIIDVLTFVDFQKIVENERIVIETYEGVLYGENFEVSPFKEVTDKLIELRQKDKIENLLVRQRLVKLNMNRLYGEQIGKDIVESCSCNSEVWMMTEFDERALDYQKNNYGSYILKMKVDPGSENEVKKVNIMPLQLGVFVLSNSKIKMKNFIHAIDGLYTNDVYYTDTDN